MDLVTLPFLNTTVGEEGIMNVIVCFDGLSIFFCSLQVHGFLLLDTRSLHCSYSMTFRADMPYPIL